jgi:Holliday junction resolvasome RuvABC endonuclease subunit
MSAIKAGVSRLPLFCGIDPGFNGGLALIDENSSLVGLCDMPLRSLDTRHEVDGVALACILREWTPDFVTLERVWGRAGEGGKNAFAFGRATGIVIGVLYSLGFAFIEVAPATWMSVILRGRTEEGKGRSLGWAHEHFPTAELVTKRGRMLDGRSDALGLAVYGVMLSKRQAA